MKNSDRPKVQLRNGFSDRMKFKTENTEIQFNALNDRTRVALVNAIKLTWNMFFDSDRYTIYGADKNGVLIDILASVYSLEVNYRANYKPPAILDIIIDTIYNGTYDDVLTIIEYVIGNLNTLFVEEVETFSYFNSVLEKEYVGYRFANEKIVPITDSNEIESIRTASNSPYSQVNKHFDKALEKLSDRDNPDYENSIKESISAVECMCSIILGESATLGDALKKLKKSGLTIHPALETAFGKLYGYTSDGTGIRHAGQIGGADSTFEEAKFMLVSCSAFANYLVGALSKYGKK